MLYSFPLLITFILFSILLLALFYRTSYRWVALLISSVLFYFLFVNEFIFVLFLFSLIIHFGGIIISRKNFPRPLHWLIITVSLFPLILFKFSDLIPQFHISYFVGLSFFTFNGISYLIDIKRGYQKPERNYFIVLLYLSYFPALLAGPLHRAKHLIPQFQSKIILSNQNFSSAFRLILWGWFKNYVLATHFKFIVDTIFNAPDDYTGFYVLFGGFAFVGQIYCDFTSYIDISQGISALFGIKTNSNFKDRVYASASRTEFWEGWHITLNHWFRDYFFFEITKGISERWKLNFALLLTFILIGLWHGATLAFVLWGLLNGIWILLEKKFNHKFDFINQKWKNTVGIIYHLFFASIIALFFRSYDLQKTFSSLFCFTESPNDGLYLIKLIALIIPAFLFMDYVYRKAKNKRIDEYIGEQTTLKRWIFYFGIAFMILVFGKLSDDFYYFKF